MRVIKNFLYNASYNVLLLLIPLITQPYISRVLQPYGNGVYQYTYTIIQYFVLLGDLGITLYGKREIAYHRDDPHSRSKIFWEIEGLQVITTTISLIFFLIFVGIDRQFVTIQVLQVLWLFSASVDVSWYFMGLEQFGKTVLRSTIVKLLSIILIFTFVKQPSDLWKYTIIQGGAQLIGGLTLWPYLPQTITKIRLSDLNILKHFKPSLILFIPNIAVQIYSVVNKTMLKQFDTVSATSYFTFGDNIVRTVLAVVTATGTVMLPRIANRFAKGNMHAVHLSLYRNMNFVASIATPMMFGIAAVGEQFAPRFFGMKYLLSGKVIVAESPIILLIAWSTVIGMQYLMPVKRMRDYTVSVTLGAISNIIINIPLIIEFGAVGTAMATVVSEAIVTLYQIYVVRDAVDLRQMFQGQWKYLLSGLVMYGIVKWMTSYWSFSILHFITEVTVGCIIYSIGVLLTRAQIVTEIRSVLNSRLHK